MRELSANEVNVVSGGDLSPGEAVVGILVLTALAPIGAVTVFGLAAAAAVCYYAGMTQ